MLASLISHWLTQFYDFGEPHFWNFQIFRFFLPKFPDFQNESGNLRIWKFRSENIFKSGNLEFEFVLYVAVKVWMSRAPDFQIFLD